MTTPDQLTHLKQQCSVLLEWIKAKKEGREVDVERRYVGETCELKWDRILGQPRWMFQYYEYRLVYPEAKKREPKRGDRIMVRDYTGSDWNPRIFVGLVEGHVVTKIDEEAPASLWRLWKFPDDPDPIPDLTEKAPSIPVKTKRVPLTAEDWKGVWWVRSRYLNEDGVHLVTSVTRVNLKADNIYFSHESARDGWLRSQDGVTWSPCSKEEV